MGSAAVRINSQTELDFTAVDDNTLQMRLAQGSMTIRVRNIDDGQVYEIDTPNAWLSIRQASRSIAWTWGRTARPLRSVWSGNAAGDIPQVRRSR